MNLYQIMFDTIRITVRANSQEEAFNLIREKDGRFIKRYGQYQYIWGPDYIEPIYFHQIPEIPMIVQWESH